VTQIYISSVINAPASQVWSLIRDFNALPLWVPAVAESRIEAGLVSDTVGCIRAMRLHEGGFIREQLLALSDYDMSCSYSILESPMDLQNYMAVLKLNPVTDGDKTFAEWSAEFVCDADKEADLVNQIGQNVFQSAFESLNQRFAA
jgi:hypothetical protein